MGRKTHEEDGEKGRELRNTQGGWRNRGGQKNTLGGWRNGEGAETQTMRIEKQRGNRKTHEEDGETGRRQRNALGRQRKVHV